MPYLKAILMNANDKTNRMLRAKAMECISLVGMAVGKEKFRDDAKQVVFNLVKHVISFVSFLISFSPHSYVLLKVVIFIHTFI